jgi:NADPH2:quinone reductase
MDAILVTRTGGPEVLEPSELPRPEPGPGDLLVKVSAAGVNFIDVYQRTGLYPIKLPLIPGSELSGVVEAVGAEATGFSAGDRVAIAHGSPVGAYAQYAAIPAQRAVPVPPGVTDKVACAVMLQGMTAHYLAYSIRPLQSGMTCLVHAAAGGVGLLLCQIAKQLGARVIGTVSTDEKAQLAREAGADEIIMYTREEVVPAVKRMTQNRGIDVAFDSVGKTTFESSLLSLVPRGMLVSFGQSSGAVPPVDPLMLSRNGSLFLTRPTLAHYVTTREELLQRANDLFAWIARGKLRVRIGAEYPLAAAADAHRALEARATTGKVLLLPSA